MSSPGDLEIVTVDPFDDRLFEAWYAVYKAALEAAVGVEEAQVYGLGETRVQWQQPTSDEVRTAYAGLVDGEVVAMGAVDLPLLENLTAASVEVAVAPEHQRRGHGRTMLAHVERAVATAGRTRLTSEVVFRYEHGTSGHDADGSRDVAFAEAAGYRLGISDVQRWLDLPVADALLDELAAEAATRHEGYELRSWAGPVPDELAQGWAELDGSLMTEAPMGEMEHEAMNVDVARLREQEESIARQQRTAYHSVALDGAGTVAAYSMLVQGDASTVAYQWGTLVHRDHRGHRLGLAVKVANQRLLQRERSDTTRVSTWNAEVNDHMIGVNEQLGFRPVSRMGEFQRFLA
ncbi:GNAT family N-acetyltransferase [Nocardioides plantarum]|uniref:GNAT family N-acetyltransferase n=1 Tax=Nocardioides plantarum TaxID=29299 RepID=A0ABV5KA84_9ACTN|nr:GNAT family N-acetyltransferase [Nocardioides plantarum]